MKKLVVWGLVLLQGSLAGARIAQAGSLAQRIEEIAEGSSFEGNTQSNKNYYCKLASRFVVDVENASQRPAVLSFCLRSKANADQVHECTSAARFVVDVEYVSQRPGVFMRCLNSNASPGKIYDCASFARSSVDVDHASQRPRVFERCLARAFSRALAPQTNRW